MLKILLLYMEDCYTSPIDKVFHTNLVIFSMIFLPICVMRAAKSMNLLLNMLRDMEEDIEEAKRIVLDKTYEVIGHEEAKKEILSD